MAHLSSPEPRTPGAGADHTLVERQLSGGRATSNASVSIAQRLLRRLIGEPLPTEHYAAFISYRRLDPDRAFAVRLHRSLETYLVPKSLGKVRRLGRMFRDVDELAASSDLGGEIRSALDRSDWLIVVCSPRARASLWVNAEIRHFAETGRAHRVLAVLIEGEPQQAFPEALFELRHQGSQERPISDLVAADARPEPGISQRERIKGALLGLVAPMLGIPLNALRRRDHVRAVRRLATVAVGSLAVLGAIATLAVVTEINRREARARQLQALERESLLLANLARQQTAAGDAVTGALLALRGLPIKADDRPVVGDAIGALMEALAERREGAALKASASGVVPSPDGQSVIVLANPGNSVLWEPSSGRTLDLPHERPVSTAAFSSDGLLLATGDWDGLIKLWTRQGDLVRTMHPHSDGLELLAFSANDKELVTISHDGTARRTTLDGASRVLNPGNVKTPLRSAAFDQATGTLVGGMEDGNVMIWLGNGEHRVLKPSKKDGQPAVALSRQARRLLVRWPKSGATVYDLPSGRRTPIAIGADATASALSPDGEVVVAGAGKRATRVWSATSGQFIADLPGHTDEVTDVRFSPQGTLVATSSNDGTIALWRVAGWTRVARLSGHLSVVYRVAFMPDSETLVSTSFDETVRTWAVRSPGEKLELIGHTGAVRSAELSAAGDTLVTASLDGSVRFWQLQSGQEKTLARPQSGPIFDAIFAPARERFMLNAWDKQLEFWALEPPQRLDVFTVPSDKVKGMVAPDGRFVLTNDGGALDLVEVSSKSKLRSWPSKASPVGAFHPSRSLLLISASEELAVIDAATRRQLVHKQISGTTDQVGFDADGTLAFVKQTNGDITIFDALTLNKRATLSGHDGFSSVVMLPSCRTIVTTSRPGKVRVWDFPSEVPRFEVSMRDEVPRIAVSPDCRSLAITGDDLVRLVDLTSAADIAILKNPQAKLTFAEFLPALSMLLTADTAGVIHRWPLPRSPATLVTDAAGLLPRRLTADQERQFGLR